MSHEQRLCSYCHQYKPWIWSEQRLKDGSKKYVDDKNARWAGKRCPDCERKRVRAALKCTSFERDLVFNELEKQGFTILSLTIPVRVRKDGREFTVGVRYATTKGSQILLEDDGLTPDYDFYVVLFSTVRMLGKQQIEHLTQKARQDITIDLSL